MDEQFIAEILMVLCFMPIVLYLLLTGWEYVAHRWVRQSYRRDRIYRSWRQNVRVLK